MFMSYDLLCSQLTNSSLATDEPEARKLIIKLDGWWDDEGEDSAAKAVQEYRIPSDIMQRIEDENKDVKTIIDWALEKNSIVGRALPHSRHLNYLDSRPSPCANARYRDARGNQTRPFARQTRRGLLARRGGLDCGQRRRMGW